MTKGTTGVPPEDVDVYGTRPEALPFHRCNRGASGKVWGHFFTTRPAGAASGVASGGPGSYVRVVPGGLWVRYDEEKAYADADGDVLGYRCRFAFHGEDGKLTAWRMKEFRLNEGAAAYRGVAFHPVAKNLVAWKVYNDVEEPLSDDEGDDEDEDEDDEAEEMEVDDPVAAAACTEDDLTQRQDKKKKQKLRGCVVRKVFTKPAVPPPSARSSDDGSAGSSSRYRSADEEAGYPGEEQARKRARWV
ncbi:hypothetical protein TRIUR3_11154 [Triticum urartu]|uniref:Uncharacterized protein n=1 Tax=Triticum urartu TaxID=4572 RepID=M7YKI6_TRIUA|nr:hypothetical protein TRIUR3_11154 [Triticum urartu]